MAKKKTIRGKKSSPSRSVTEKSQVKSRKKLSTIKPPPAPPVIHSPEVGAPVSQGQAIRERLRLYPRATVREIIAMFELEGVKITPEAVKKAKRK